MSDDNLSVFVWRGDHDGYYEDFQVPRRASQTVLDVITYIQRELDPSLSYRFACRVGVCGSCAMSVNDTPRWTCRTHVEKVVVDGKLTVGPLSNLTVIKDLATDMRVFFDKWQKADGRFHGSDTRNEPPAPLKPDSKKRRIVDEAIECINCGVCYAACDTVKWNDAYLGPAALNRAWTLQNDERDASFDERLDTISQEGGCYSCHSHQSCQVLCPAGLNPTASIAGLKKLSLVNMIKGRSS